MSGTSNRLKGLKGLSGLSEKERWAFMDANADVLNQYRNLRNRERAAEALYMNKQFIDKFGIDAFNKFDGSQAAFDMRNQMLKDTVANEEYAKRFKNNMDENMYNRYNQLSSDAKIELLESDYLTPKEFDAKWKKHIEQVTNNNKVQPVFNSNAGAFIMSPPQEAVSTGNKTADALRFIGTEESGKRYLQDKNNRILENIFSRDVDKAAEKYSDQIKQAYYDLMGWDDNKVIKEFYKIITPGSYTDENGIKNMGIGPYAAHYTLDHKQVHSAMKNFGVDDMREVIAKKRVYDTYMSPDMSHTALENDAKRYIAGHQGKLQRLGLFMKDVNISAMSYTADKINGIAEIGRASKDALAEKGKIAKPVVWVDEEGKIIDPNKAKIFKGKSSNGKVISLYKDNEGNTHSLHREQVSYSALHQLGKNEDGSDISGMGGIDFLTLNPQYWTRAEQFGTLDEDEQKQYEKLGYSPYKVMYEPGKDSDLLYETYKMISFGIADQATMLIPFGIGAMGRGIQGVSRLGKAGMCLGKVMDTTGRFFTASKFGQVTNGLVGAGGIAYAYGRGAFQETLAQNYANLEERVLNKVQHDVYDRYQNDKDYKAAIDKLVAEEAARMKQEYLAQMSKEGGMQPADMKAIDKVINAKAHDVVIGRMVEQGVKDAKESDDYAALQEHAIKGAGNAATVTFLPEAVKYGLVNNLGHRKFLYQNPSGVTRRVSSAFNGLREVTTKDGLKRLATEASKFKTWKQKGIQFGKTAASQAWGGAWTNGTDDMQVDAAERINEDSFNRYLDAYSNGEAIATTYGFADGFYSYLKGLGNSVGQTTTWDATTVGALGGVLNIAPNFTNIASLATKEGRQHYKDNYWRTVIRDENGMPIKDKDGKIQYKQYQKKVKTKEKGDDDKTKTKVTTTSTDVNKWNNWRGQANFFIQNGILNTYYGKRMAESDLQNHADYVNNLLDNYNDFHDIEGLVAANLASEDFSNPGDEKTMKFLNALYAMKTLRNLGENSNDPTTMSSVVQNAKALIERASRAGEVGKNALSEEETKSLLAEYYAHTKNIPQSEETAKQALEIMAKNSQILQEANDAIDIQENVINRYEKAHGEKVDPLVRQRLLLNQALNEHWKDRRTKMREELGDNSSFETPNDPSVAIATVGGRKNAKDLVKVYDQQIKEFTEAREKAQENAGKAKAEYDEALKKAKSLEEGSTERVEAEKKAKELNAKYESAKQEVRFNDALIERTLEKRSPFASNKEIFNQMDDANDRKLNVIQDELARIEKELADLKKRKKKYYRKDGSLRKLYSDGNGNAKQKYAEEIAELNKKIEGQEDNVRSITEQINKYKDRTLTSEEIFNLDPVTRARMMSKDNRDLYSKEQQKEIEKLEKELLQKDPDALQKIQDISLLTQRIFKNEDAIFRILENPEAAAYAIENERVLASHAAYKLTNQRTAESIAEAFAQWEHDNENVSAERKSEIIYKNLRKLRSDLLDIIDNDHLMPQYQKEIADAKEWRKVVDDIDAVVDSFDRDNISKEMLKKTIDSILDNADSKDEIINTLEKVVDDTDNNATSSAKDFEYILDGLEKLGYQRDATVIEDRKQRRTRERLEREEREKERKKAEEEAKAAAEKAKEEEEERKAKEEEERKRKEKENSSSTAEESYNAQQAAEAKPKVEVAADGSNAVSTTPDVVDVNVADAELKGMQPGIWNVGLLLDDEYGDGSIDAGDMWYGSEKSPHKGTFKVERKGNTITFTLDDKSSSLTILKDEYESSDEEESKSFEATSMEKKDGEWYFNGNFAGSKETTQVKAKKDFDIDQAIGRQQSDRETALASAGVDTGSHNLIIEDDTILGKAASLDEQYEEASSKGNNVQLSESHTDSDALEDASQSAEKNNPNHLSGTAIPQWDRTALTTDKKLVQRKGKNKGDTLDQFFDWLKAAGIKLQNIVDQELADIIKQNPHAKVKFMVVKPDNNATNDRTMRTHLMLVLDYDNSINKGITEIHNKDNGGVIESNGKKYLVIGTVGHGKDNVERLALYDILFSNDPHSPNGYGLVRRKMGRFFQEHPTERFFVDEELSTEVVPTYPTPGRIVKQMEGDSKPTVRKVSELLKEDSRNPYGYRSLSDLAWGIQERSDYKFMIVNKVGDVMVPSDPEKVMGSAFVLIPAGNGKLIPSYLEVRKYTEMHEGKLKERIEHLLDELVAPGKTREQRVDILVKLSRIFYFKKEGATILIGKGNKEISLVYEGIVEKTFTLDDNFDRTAFNKAFEAINPRINITAEVLGNSELLEEYDEAGALMTDAAMLGTAGSSYYIYALDAEGKMIMPKEEGNNVFKGTNNSDFKNGDRKQIIYRQQYYLEKDDGFYLNGDKVTDENIVKHLNYIKRVLDGGLAAVKSEGVWNFFILSEGEHPEVVKINRNSKEVKEIPEKEAKELIKEFNEEVERKKRALAAGKTLEEIEAQEKKLAKSKDVDLGDGDLSIDPTTGELGDNGTSNTETGKDTTPPKDLGTGGKDTPSVDLGKSTTGTDNTQSGEGNSGKGNNTNTQRATDIASSKKYRKRIKKLVKDKFKTIFNSNTELEKLLKEHDIEIDNIGTSEKDIEAWIKTIEDCR